MRSPVCVGAGRGRTHVCGSRCPAPGTAADSQPAVLPMPRRRQSCCTCQSTQQSGSTVHSSWRKKQRPVIDQLRLNVALALASVVVSATTNPSVSEGSKFFISFAIIEFNILHAPVKILCVVVHQMSIWVRHHQSVEVVTFPIKLHVRTRSCLQCTTQCVTSSGMTITQLLCEQVSCHTSYRDFVSAKKFFVCYALGTDEGTTWVAVFTEDGEI